MSGPTAPAVQTRTVNVDGRRVRPLRGAADQWRGSPRELDLCFLLDIQWQYSIRRYRAILEVSMGKLLIILSASLVLVAATSAVALADSGSDAGQSIRAGASCPKPDCVIRSEARAERKQAKVDNRAERKQVKVDNLAERKQVKVDNRAERKQVKVDNRAERKQVKVDNREERRYKPTTDADPWFAKEYAREQARKQRQSDRTKAQSDRGDAKDAKITKEKTIFWMN